MKKTLRALQFFREDAGLLWAAAIFLVFNLGANLLKPWPIALLVDSVLGTKPLPGWLDRWQPEKLALIPLLTAAILILHVGQGALSAGQNYLTIKVGLRGLRRVRNALFSQLLRLSLRFYQNASSGDLIYRASWDTYSFQTLFQQGLVTFLTAYLSLLLMVIVMWRLDPQLTGVSLVVVPVLVASIRLFGKRMRERGVAAQRADSDVTTRVQRTITALPLIQSYVREDLEEKAFRHDVQLAQEKRMGQHGWELLYWLAVAVVFGGGTAVIVWFGAHRVVDGKLTVGELLVFIAYLAQLYEPLNQLSHVGATISSASAGTERVFEILDSSEEVQSGDRPVVKSGQANSTSLVIRGAVAFEAVSFAYRPKQRVLNQITFQLQPGQSAAIIGPSGAGKTTLLNLVPRFFDPDAGRVILDGVDLKELRLRDLRAHVALVPQEPILLSATVSENISYGRPDASAAMIEAAAVRAHAAEFIEKLPQRYDTIIGEGAAHLSVGEKQRLSLARAFLKDAPILLLDEPTSALDLESEQFVLESLLELMRGRTTLMVAHRLTTIRHVNQILVLEHGELIEQGAPEKLLQSNGYYARILKAQSAT